MRSNISLGFGIGFFLLTIAGLAITFFSQGSLAKLLGLGVMVWAITGTFVLHMVDEVCRAIRERK